MRDGRLPMDGEEVWVEEMSPEMETVSSNLVEVGVRGPGGVYCCYRRGGAATEDFRRKRGLGLPEKIQNFIPALILLMGEGGKKGGGPW